jgi:hypothetical protein
MASLRHGDESNELVRAECVDRHPPMIRLTSYVYEAGHRMDLQELGLRRA